MNTEKINSNISGQKANVSHAKCHLNHYTVLIITTCLTKVCKFPFDLNLNTCKHLKRADFAVWEIVTLSLHPSVLSENLLTGSTVNSLTVSFSWMWYLIFQECLKGILIHLMQTHPWTQNDCDLTKHTFGLNWRIHTVIVTRFSHKHPTGWNYILHSQGQLRSDITIFCKKLFSGRYIYQYTVAVVFILLILLLLLNQLNESGQTNL